MDRRELLKALAALASVTGLGMGSKPSHYGPLTVERHRALCMRGIHLHTFHRGVDVTSRCRFVDDTPGRQRAELFLRNAEGRFYVDRATRSAAMEVVTENIEVRAGAPFA